MRRQTKAGRFAFECELLPVGALLFPGLLPLIDVFLATRNQPIYEAGQMPRHNLDRLRRS